MSRTKGAKGKKTLEKLSEAKVEISEMLTELPDYEPPTLPVDLDEPIMSRDIYPADPALEWIDDVPEKEKECCSKKLEERLTKLEKIVVKLQKRFGL